MGQISIDITGIKYSNFTAISHEGYGNWKFRCDCGNIVIKKAFDVKKGKIKACSKGCRTGMPSKHPLYNTWRSIRRRCYGINSTSYKYYGARGIKMCESWKNNFWTFVKDMGEKPLENSSVERLNNDQDYSKENCIWATPEEQASNKRTNVYVYYKDTKYTFAQICRLLNLNRSVTNHRCIKSKVTPQEYFDKNIF